MSLTASHVAVALVAACRLFEIDPTDAFGDVRGAAKARLAAAAACHRLGLGEPDLLASTFRVARARQLAPSQIAARNILPEHLAVIVEALNKAGLVVMPAPLPAAPEPAAAPARDKAGAKLEKPAATAPVRRVGPGWMPRRAGPGRPRSGGERAVGGAGRWTGPRDGVQKRIITRQGPGTARPSASPIEAARGPVRLKPVTARIARWAGFFPPECWSHDEVADLFDVHPDALLDAMDPPLAGEAA